MAELEKFNEDLVGQVVKLTQRIGELETETSGDFGQMKRMSDLGNEPVHVQDALGNVNEAFGHVHTDPNTVRNPSSDQPRTHHQENANVPQNTLMQDDADSKRCGAADHLLQGQFHASHEGDSSRDAQPHDEEMHAI